MAAHPAKTIPELQHSLLHIQNVRYLSVLHLIDRQLIGSLAVGPAGDEKPPRRSLSRYESQRIVTARSDF